MYPEKGGFLAKSKKKKTSRKLFLKVRKGVCAQSFCSCLFCNPGLLQAHASSTLAFEA